MRWLVFALLPVLMLLLVVGVFAGLVVSRSRRSARGPSRRRGLRDSDISTNPYGSGVGYGVGAGGVQGDVDQSDHGSSDQGSNDSGSGGWGGWGGWGGGGSDGVWGGSDSGGGGGGGGGSDGGGGGGGS